MTGKSMNAMGTNKADLDDGDVDNLDTKQPDMNSLHPACMSSIKSQSIVHNFY